MQNTEPVLTANGIVAAISAVIAMLVAFGVISLSGEQQQLMIAAIVAVLGVIGPIVGGIWARNKVTPLADPQDEDGARLVRADGNIPLAQMRSMRSVIRG